MPCQVIQIESKLDKESGKELEKNPQEIKRNEEAIIRINLLRPFVAEIEQKVPKLGRFVLRDSNRTVAAGEILEIFN
jgi:elongation factor 1-alpha